MYLYALLGQNVSVYSYSLINNSDKQICDIVQILICFICRYSYALYAAILMLYMPLFLCFICCYSYALYAAILMLYMPLFLCFICRYSFAAMLGKWLPDEKTIVFFFLLKLKYMLGRQLKNS